MYSSIHEKSLPLFTGSSYSLLWGCHSPSALAARAAELGYGALALGDVNALYGLPELVEASREAGIKPIAAAELSFRAGGKAAGYRAVGAAGYRAVGAAEYRAVGAAEYRAVGEGLSRCSAYCMEKRGFSRLCELITRLRGERSEGTAYDLEADLRDSGFEGLAIASRDPDFLERIGPRSKEGLFVSLPYGKPFRAARDLAALKGFPILAEARSIFFSPGDEERYRLLRAVDLRSGLSSLEGAKGYDAPDPARRAPSAKDLAAFYSAVPEALANAARLAERAADAESFFSRPCVFPGYDGLREEESCALLARLCEEGGRRRYGELSAFGRRRLERELSIIRGKGFASYFLVVRDIVNQCPRTCGRGSAASSIVSYLLGLTHVDPLRHELFFERFLNEGRTDPPDIDIDFPWDERDRVLRYVFRKYEGRSGMVADHCTFAWRSALRESAIAFGVGEAELGKFASLSRMGRKDEIPEAILAAADSILGLPRYIGTHPGGVVITPGPITRYVHVQPSPIGYPVIAWEKDGTEFAGLVKIDLLGNRSLGVLRDCIELANDKRPPEGKLTWENVSPLEDRKSRSLMEEGRTLGIFYVESPATRQLLRKMRTGDYEHLVVASSIIRPAANKYINEYVRRLSGGEWKRLHASVEETLAETYGIMVYQEDVSRVAMAAAGFSGVEADALRKTISKKRRSARLGEFREAFMAGTARRGLPLEEAEALWDMMLSFDGYSFCKSHSASYALVSYKLAWLRVRYPLEFFACVINNGGGFYSRQVYINEVRRLGFPVAPPDLNRSAFPFTCEDLSSGERILRTGLCQLKEADRPFLETLLEDRDKRGEFSSFIDLLHRVFPNFLSVRSLIRSGTLDSVPYRDGSSLRLTRPQMFWAYHAFRKGGRGREELFPLLPEPAWVGDYRESTKLADEAAFLDLIVSRHPAALFAERARDAARRRKYPLPVTSDRIPSLRDRLVSLCGTAVAGKEVPTKKAESMSFFSFEDERGIFETVLFPKAYERLLPVLELNSAFLVVGIVKNEYGAFSVNVEDLVGLSRPA